MRIDLHTHTTASDGTDTPAQLVAAAAGKLDVLAITDHDTAAGWQQVVHHIPMGLTVIPATEMSCVYLEPGGRRISLHLLAYLVDPEHPALNAEWQRLRDTRRSRARRMVAGLVDAGFPISWEQVALIAAGGSVGRPHIARALVASGVVPDVATAFTQVLSSRQPYYVPKPDTDVFRALALLREAGGLPVFAHPLARRRGPVVTDEVIAAMAAAGLVGLEVDHPDHDAADRSHAARLSQQLDLIPTGSSDYHGANKTVGLGAELTDPAAFDRLMGLPAALVPVRGTSKRTDVSPGTASVTAYRATNPD